MTGHVCEVVATKCIGGYCGPETEKIFNATYLQDHCPVSQYLAPEQGLSPPERKAFHLAEPAAHSRSQHCPTEVQHQKILLSSQPSGRSPQAPGQ